MTDDQLVDVLMQSIQSESARTREACEHAIETVRRDVTEDMRRLREENAQDHAAVTLRLDEGERRFRSLEESLEEFRTDVGRRFDVPRRFVLKAGAAIASSGVLGVLAVRAVQTILGG